MDGLGPSGETIIDYSIYDAVKAGFGKVVYIVREYFLEDMKEHVAKRYAGVKCSDGSPLEFVFVTQELDKIPAGFTLNPERQKPWGTAHAVLMAKDVIDEPFIIINGDDYYGKDSFKVAADWCRAHENTKGQYAIIGFEMEKTLSESGSVSRGICHYDASRKLTSVVEHLNIQKEADGKVYGDNSVSGETHIVLDGKALCSMNMAYRLSGGKMANERVRKGNRKKKHHKDIRCDEDVHVTYHGIKRVRERLGLPKNAVMRNLDKAIK